MTEIKLLELLGKDKSSEIVKEFLNSLNEICHYDEIDEDSFYECKKNGLEIKFNLNRLVAVFLYGSSEEGFNIYRGKIPLGIRFDWSRKKVREELGLPSDFGHARAIKSVIPESIWDRYDLNEFQLHITYSSEECVSIKKITLMPLKPVS